MRGFCAFCGVKVEYYIMCGIIFLKAFIKRENYYEEFYKTTF